MALKVKSKASVDELAINKRAVDEELNDTWYWVARTGLGPGTSMNSSPTLLPLGHLIR